MIWSLGLDNSSSMYSSKLCKANFSFYAHKIELKLAALKEHFLGHFLSMYMVRGL